MAYPVIPPSRGTEEFLITREVDIAAPLDVVFSVVEDLELFEELESNVKRVEITTDIKRGLGMKSRWTLDDGAGGSWYVDEEIIHYDKPHQYAYVGSSPDKKDYAGVHTLTTNPDGGTHLHFAELFFFSGDQELMGRVIDGMMANVKLYSEKRVRGA